MRVWRIFLLAVMVAVAALSGGCQSAPADKSAQAEPAPAMRAMGQPVESPVPSGEETSDESIGFEIRRILNTDPASSSGIIVEVDDGKVMLRGIASNLAASWRAEAAARTVKGVKTVMNQIVVSTPAIAP